MIRMKAKTQEDLKKELKTRFEPARRVKRSSPAQVSVRDETR
jgi:hypothetical protein